MTATAVATTGRLHEMRVERWLRELGHTPERFPPRRRRLSKTPDFAVHTLGGDQFLVEVKSIKAEQPGFGALALKFVRARQQFDAVNQGGLRANVVVIAAVAPHTLLEPIHAMANRENGPLLGLDLILGTGLDGAVNAVVLHAAIKARHIATLRAALPVLGDERRPGAT